MQQKKINLLEKKTSDVFVKKKKLKFTIIYSEMKIKEFDA